jgi:hypothetical protein
MGRGKSVSAATVIFTALALSSAAHAGSVRIRWLPSSATAVIGYKVYTRVAETPYAAPEDVALPDPAADGTLAWIVGGLTAGQRYFFAVSAYTADEESVISEEYLFGAVDPCGVDSCLAATSCEIHPVSDGTSCDDRQFCNGHEQCIGGVCRAGAPPDCSDAVACTTDSCNETLRRCIHQAQPGCCGLDADCVDNDLCTTGERCVRGTCVNTAVVCPEPPCTQAFCDPVSGCGTVSVADAESCNAADLCGGAAAELAARKVKLVGEETTASFHAKGLFAALDDVDPVASGVTLEVADPSGAVIYSAFLPGELITGRDGTRYRASVTDVQASGGIRALGMKLKQGLWFVSIRAESPALLAAIGPSQLNWALRIGATCVRQPDLACDAQSAFAVCR